ncbi:hypothetical protein H8M03_03090 [Sphingomonas sabuli]|uniref:asparagine synthase (glutamine-hydrolyzing) n=1 Tax=Sphingomonas sabuli TaxID=2764186 RepID=A0A7G9L3Z7_9SPHN|nr:asparagine synthase-related protein [Sphingomonas sabuli]QNM83346.1 hypothetical protein H8M03_03090 [Sphingomonas sabuli]
MGEANGRLSQLTLVTSPDLPWLAGRAALLVGRLFERDTNREISDGAALDRAIANDEEELLRTHWGSYVLVHETKSGDLKVLRDPSGAIPCYVAGPDREVILSDATIGRALNLIERPQIDWAFVVQWLQFPFLRVAGTGLDGVTELTPGASRPLACSQSSETQLWRPLSFARAAMDEPDDAARMLRQTALSSVPRASGDALTLIQISGGLDSSILAACLAARGRNLKAMTFATSSPDGDERQYAEAVAGHLGIPLEIVHESDVCPSAPAPPGFRPGINLLLDAIDRTVEDYRQAIGAGIVVDGGGGDSLFGFSRTAAPILDAFRAGEAWATMRSVSERSSASMWRVAEVTLRQLLRRPSGWPDNPHFLGSAARLRPAERHPWLAGAARLPRGKLEHLTSLVHIQHFLDRHAIGGDHRHPLMNQPLIELCLSIPSWMWNADGCDRAVARRAFWESLPRSITERRTKGSLQGYFHRRFLKLRPDMRPLLLDGELARRQLVDRAAIEAALRDDEVLSDDRALRLSEIATLESWLSAWCSLGAS